MSRDTNVIQRCRQRAYIKLAHMHYDEFADLLAAERIREGLPGDTWDSRSPQNAARCGTRSKYILHGCRCRPCKDAMAAYQRQRTAIKRADLAAQRQKIRALVDVS